jgi:hypothetical protein
MLLSSFSVLREDTGALPFYITNATRWLAGMYDDMGQPAEAAKYRAMLSVRKIP